MNLPRVGILHRPGGAAGIPEIIRAARGVCKPVFVFDEQVAAANPTAVSAARTFGEAVVWPRTEVAARAASFGLDGVTTFHDAELDQCDQIIAAASLPGHGDQPNVWDKLLQRQMLHDADLSRINGVAVDSYPDLLRAVDRFGLPSVVKPRRGVGGVGVSMLSSPSDLEREFRGRRKWSHLLLEPCLPAGDHPTDDRRADFVSVETASVGTAHHHLATFDKLPVSIHRSPALEGGARVLVTGDITPSRLTRARENQAIQATHAALSVLGIRDRVTHTELKLSPVGAEVIEVNGRVGGFLDRLLRLRGDAILVESALRLASGRGPVRRRGEWGGHAAGMFPPFAHLEGVVASRVSRLDLRSIPCVMGVDALAMAGESRESNDWRVANVTMRAVDAESLHRAIRTTAVRLMDLYSHDLLAGHDWWQRITDGCKVAHG